MIQRSYFQVVINRINEPRRFIQVLYGPRQVGKTTIITQVLKVIDMPYIFATADDVAGADNTWIRKVWSEARTTCRQNGLRPTLLVIDEVQKVQNWSETVKKEWDADTFNELPIKVILLGSSSPLIQKGLTESLAGRFESIHIPHWSFSEMHDAFGWSVEQYIWFGGYPGTADLIPDEKRWKQYVRGSLIETSLSKDILMMTRVDKPALLRRLFDIGCTYSSQILALTKVQGELMEKGNISTLSNYLTLLETAGLLCGLEKYSGDIIRKRSSKPKFQVFNNALLTSQSPMTFSEGMNDSRYWGRIFESAVGTHLLNLSTEENYRVYYWNDRGQEVDYVIENGRQSVAIEVKSGKDSYNSGLSAFDALYHPQSLYTIGTDGIPIEDFLSMNPADLF